LRRKTCNDILQEEEHDGRNGMEQGRPHLHAALTTLIFTTKNMKMVDF
jgi:hypothetical protein